MLATLVTWSGHAIPEKWDLAGVPSQEFKLGIAHPHLARRIGSGSPIAAELVANPGMKCPRGPFCIS